MAVFEEPSAAERRTLDTPMGPVSYVDEGPPNAPALVLVHGLPGSARDFRWLTPGLGALRAVRVEMPGHGDTPLRVEPSPEVTDRGRFVLEFCRVLGLDRPALLGHSMGGVVATAAIDRAPEAFRGLALVASPGVQVHTGFKKFPRHLVSRGLKTPLLRHALRRALPSFFRRSGFRHGTVDEFEHTMHCVSATLIPEHAARLERVALPTFHAWCDDDPLVDGHICAEVADLLGGPALRFADGGHNPQKHHAVELSEALVAWVRALP